MRKRFRTTPIHALLAAAVLGLLVMPLAFAGAASGPKASSSVVTDAKFKKLKQRITALEGRGGNATTPSGPAGGDLTGTYPNPTIQQNAVGTDEVQADSLTAADLAPNSVANSEMADNAVGSAEVIDESLSTGDLGLDSVGSSELKATRASVTGTGVAAAANTPVTATVECDPGEAALGGGYAWTDEGAAADVKMSASAPAQDPPAPVTGWSATGESAVANTLFAWAVCLDV